MDIITQLQDQVNTIASIAFNTFGTLQRDAPPMRLSSNYPEPAPSSTNPTEQPPDLTEQTMNMSTALVQSAKTVSHFISIFNFFQVYQETCLTYFCFVFPCSLISLLLHCLCPMKKRNLKKLPNLRLVSILRCVPLLINYLMNSKKKSILGGK